MASKKKSGKQKVQARAKRAETPKAGRTSAPTKKATSKKVTAKKAPAKKGPAKKATAKQATPAKAAPAKAAPAKSAEARSPASAPARLPRAQAASAETAAPLGRSAAVLPAPGWLRAEGRGDERRRFQRIPREMKVRLFAGGASKTHLECNLRSVDVSLSGLFLRSTFFLPEGTPVHLEINVSSEHTAEASGTVARVVRDGDVTGFAIQFDGLGDAALRDLVRLFVGGRIEDFVQRFVRTYRGEGGRDLLWEGLLSWELERLALAMD